MSCSVLRGCLCFWVFVWFLFSFVELTLLRKGPFSTSTFGDHRKSLRCPRHCMLKAVTGFFTVKEDSRRSSSGLSCTAGSQFLLDLLHPPCQSGQIIILNGVISMNVCSSMTVESLFHFGWTNGTVHAPLAPV